jgi:hypothetical protein
MGDTVTGGCVCGVDCERNQIDGFDVFKTNDKCLRKTRREASRLLFESSQQTREHDHLSHLYPISLASKFVRQYNAQRRLLSAITPAEECKKRPLACTPTRAMSTE